MLALLAGVVVCASAPAVARADARFGDSAWVAPAWPVDSVATDAPRVALPDHERRWETALRAPFRVVFFPLRLVALGLEAGVGYLGPRLFEPKAKRPLKQAVVVAPYFTPGAVSDFGVGPAITWAGFPTASARLSLAGSWSATDRRHVRVTGSIHDLQPVGFRVRADYDYKPNRRYFGIGNGTPETDASYYLLATTGAEGSLLFGASPLRQLRIGGG